MPSREYHSRLFRVVLVPVALVVLGAFVLSAAAIRENLRFAGAASQILGFVRMVRLFVNEQKTYSLSLGEDVWATMVRVQQIPESVPQVNPWGGKIRVLATSTTEMSIESNLPSQDCRRMALYFGGLDPEKSGILSIAARSDLAPAWSVVYPAPADKQVAAVEESCGPTKQSYLAVVFKIK
jgi:hypothetical protein